MSTKCSSNFCSGLEVENARNLTMEQLSNTFIPTKLFRRLLSRKHHVVLGARGQGKTALFRMLAFEGLSALARKNSDVKTIVDGKKYIGVYLPTKLEWIESLPLQVVGGNLTEGDIFRWKLNLSSCLAFLSTASSCFCYYICEDNARIVAERKFCRQIAYEWKLSEDCGTVQAVARALRQLGYDWQVDITAQLMCKKQSTHDVDCRREKAFAVFQTKAFIPLRRGMEVLSEILQFPKEIAWLLCIDEAEYMTYSHQRILNSFMRVAPENLFLKIATMPFSHYTFETDNPRTPVIPNHDFEYLHMNDGLLDDDDLTGKRAMLSEKDMDEKEVVFGDLLLQKFIHEYYGEGSNIPNRNLSSMFGRCRLLDNEEDADWNKDSENMKLLERYATPKLFARAVKLSEGGSRTKFMDEVGRKVRGALLLRDDKQKRTGHKKSDLYSGAKMIVKCADGNPRLMIRILNNMFAKDRAGASKGCVRPQKQDEILTNLAMNFLNQIKSFQRVGPDLYEKVLTMGNYLNKELYQNPLTSDQILSLAVKEPADDDKQSREIIETAIKYGVLKPNDASRIDFGAEAKVAGNYHLSYLFCPYFRIQPRKGKAITYQTMLKRNAQVSPKVCLNEPVQMDFNFDGRGLK